MAKANNQQEIKFFDAIKSGDVQKVRACVKDDPALLSSYDYNAFGATPLTLVAFKKDREMIELLIELGADLERRSDWEMGPWSPLHCAIQGGADDLAKFLLEKGAMLDVHTAAALGLVDDLVRMLGESPERVSERGGDGCTPMHFVGTQQAADALLQYGANLEARCIDHFSTPVQYLCDSRPKIARYLLDKGAKADVFSASMCGATDCLRKLLQEDSGILESTISQETFPPGAEYDVHNIMTFTIGGGCSALHAASAGNQPDAIKLLIESGIDPNIRGGYDDATCLHLVGWRDNLAAAKSLIACGADINSLSGEIHNNSPAGWAIVAGSADVFCFLMDCGAEVKDYFLDDAKAAVAGKFRQYKVVPQENYERILNRLDS